MRARERERKSSDAHACEGGRTVERRIHDGKKGERSAQLNSGGADVAAPLGGVVRICAIFAAGSTAGASECAVRDACGKNEFVAMTGEDDKNQ